MQIMPLNRTAQKTSMTANNFLATKTTRENIHFGFTPRSNNWTSLRLINVYRVALAGIFFSQSFLEFSPLVKIYDLSLYAWGSFVYVLLALVMMLSSWIDRRHFQRQVTIQTYIDIIAIILLMHSVGGISSGIGMLLVISITFSGLLGKDSMAITFAAIATVLLLGEFAYDSFFTAYYATSTQVGLLGIALFATALVTQRLSANIHSREAIIQQQKLDVANLSALNNLILENMQSGVIALDESDQVRHINDSARKMLPALSVGDKARLQTPFALTSALPEIHQLLKMWRKKQAPAITFLNVPGSKNSDLQVNFHSFSSRSHTGTLIYLDDVSRLKERMQQSKLAALGKLTANIAHEIRNPLSAISHASQLLAENTSLPATETRLCEIIGQHTERINGIIEDIMQISRGQDAIREQIHVSTWLNTFINSFCQSGLQPERCFELEITDPACNISCDSRHLNRIMTNLCDNAKTHAGLEKPAKISVETDDEHCRIQISDQGPGIDPKELDKIFEPFYTTSHKGSGLGLYIVSQLCELNNATINAENKEKGGAIFTVAFTRDKSQ